MHASAEKRYGYRLSIVTNRSDRPIHKRKIVDSNHSNETISTDTMLPWQHDSSLSLTSPRPLISPCQQPSALVSSGELPAIQVGGKHVWRIEESVLEQFIQDQYTATRERQKAERAQ